MNFTDWNFDTRIAVEYERIGKCNECGDCCKTIVNLRMVDGDKNLHGGVTTDGEGRWSEILGNNDREFVKFHMPDKAIEERCHALGEDNLCMLNGEKPWCCQIWPTAPSDIEPFENCSYEFIEVDRWEIDEQETARV